MVRRKHSYAEGFWTRRKIRAIVGVAIIIWILVAYETPNYSYGRFIWPHEKSYIGKNYTFKFSDVTAKRNLTYGAVTYDTNITLTTAGDFSIGEDNPIHMTAIVYNVRDVNNRTLPDIMFNMLFTGIIFEWQAIKVAGVNHPIADYPRFVESPLGNFKGIWRAEGDIAFWHPINFTGPILVATDLTGGYMVNLTKLYTVLAPQIKTYHFIGFDLQPQSFTDELSFHETEAKYGAMAFSVTLVFLLPIFEGLLISKKGQDETKKEKRRADNHEVGPKEKGEEEHQGQPSDKKDASKDRERGIY